MTKHSRQSRPPRGRPPTVYDVAKVTGVSASTVSRALSRPDLVSERTRKRIDEAVTQLGFVPNRLAGVLASNRSHIVAFVAPPIPLTLFSESIQAMMAALSKAGFQVITIYGHAGPPDIDRAIVDVLSLQPDGVVVIGAPLSAASRERLAASRLPVLEAWDMPEEPIDMVAGFSHAQLGRDIGAFLLERGYRRPLLVWSSGSRALAMQKTLDYEYVRAGYDAPQARTGKFPPDFADGREAVRAMLRDQQRPDVIVCLSDWAAHGALVEATQQGLRVPQDVAIMGFGDLDFAAELTPSLTTVRIDQARLGLEASQYLIERLRGGGQAGRVLRVAADVIARDSA